MNRASSLRRLLLPLLVSAVAASSLAGDGVVLLVTQGPDPGELTLDWTGGQPSFRVYRSHDPSDVIQPMNELGETELHTWSDTPPDLPILYYLITSRCMENPPEVCDGIDNDCDGATDEEGSEASCVLANATPTCNRGACEVLACDADFWNVDGDDANGCEYACAFAGAETIPDALYADEDCDGVDGHAADAAFVATNGTDAGACTRGAPCLTFPFALAAAEGSGRGQLYVQAGVYSGLVAIDAATTIGVYGGYDGSWVRAARSEPGHGVTLSGGSSGDLYSTFLVEGATLTLADMNLIGTAAAGAMADGAGRSSHVVHANLSVVTIERCGFLQGNGAPGSGASAGADAPLVGATPGMLGIKGGAAGQTMSCNDTTRGAAGPAGTNACGGGSSASGGVGGFGGFADTQCAFPVNNAATAGQSGSNGAQSGGPFGIGGLGGSPCGAPQAGAAGRVTNGLAGSLAPAGGIIVGTLWRARDGGSGAIGNNGGGAGGGGGSGGCDTGVDEWGAGGGGGGAGGCRAQGGGSGGKGGGGSFGLFAVNSSVDVSDCEFVRGSGSAGGAGGSGGRGQSGGVGGLGGSGFGDAFAGGGGAAGGHGGHGGGGGGGAGGISFGIYTFSSTVVQGGNSFLRGAPGAGGAGGPSAPTAPAAEQDGNAGPTGPPGTLGAVGTCANATGC